LTDKEREVMQLAAAGKANKDMAADLHLSLRAVEDRRSRMMKKLEVKSLTDLIRLVTDAKES
jgi:FixJ family two-component response regulator